LDSELEKCSWHRIQLTATVPVGTSVEVETFTAEAGTPDLSTAAFKQCLLAGFDNPDGLVQSDPGRQLWMRVTLRSDGNQTPEIHSIQAYFPRDSYLKFLPAVYQEDVDSRLFLERFLSIFQTSNDDWDQTIDNLWQLFDPMATPAAFFPTLASWLALEVNPEWSDSQRRIMLRKAIQSYAVRGTVAGIQQAIEDYAGVANARIAEDFKFRRWAALPADEPLSGGVRLWSRDVYGKLQLDVNSQIGKFRLTGAPEPALEPLTWGANRFRVYFPAGPYNAAQITSRVREVVEREKPAHAEAAYCPVLPRMRVGVQAMVGVDAVVGDINYMVLSSAKAAYPSTLNYDTILGCAAPERELRSLGLVPKPRVGVTAAIL
jgi:phage tail-like protein